MNRDFGEILDKWESRNRAPNQPGEPPGKISRDRHSSGTRGDSPGLRALEKMKPQAELDLHGMTLQEAEKELRRFLERTNRAGLKKVLVIHGKGYHSPGGEPVLKKMVRMVLESSVLVGPFGPAGRTAGGGGATWAILRDGEKQSEK